MSIARDARRALGEGPAAIADVLPMLFGTLLDRVPGVEQYQLVQTAPATLRVRLRPADDGVWQAVRDAIDRLLTDSKAEHVTIERAEEPPLQGAGGKYRRIVPLSA